MQTSDTSSSAAAPGGLFSVRSRATGGFHLKRLALRSAGLSTILLVVILWGGRSSFPHQSTMDMLTVGAAAVAFGILCSAMFVAFYLAPRVTRPASAIADLAEAVSAGDLTVRVDVAMDAGGMSRLRRAVEGMVTALRTMVTTLQGSAQETAGLASEITAGSEHMARAASEMATTSSELSRQSTGMAETIQQMANDASRLVAIATELSAGAHDGVARNTQLRELANENRVRFDESSRALSTLATDVQSSAAAVEALAAASEEIRAFVTLVQKMARQSKLLALNAAMEAARAGEHGQGFAVVANEVRRLAASSSDAAQRTEALVKEVLDRVEQSRASSARTVVTVNAVLQATQHGLQSFAQVEEAVVDAESWTTSIDQAATTSTTLITDMTTRLDALARGTESFAAAMQQVAASSEEQSASTQQIAAAANGLSTAAARLAGLVATFKLEESDPPMPLPASAGVARPPAPELARRLVAA